MTIYGGGFEAMEGANRCFYKFAHIMTMDILDVEDGYTLQFTDANGDLFTHGPYPSDESLVEVAAKWLFYNATSPEIARIEGLRSMVFAGES